MFKRVAEKSDETEECESQERVSNADQTLRIMRPGNVK